MKAVAYNGTRDVGVEDVPDARIEEPNDVLVKITTTNICGSDLHMYEGRTNFESGGIFGHENTGEVMEVGPGISRIRKGDQVSLPFNIGCGFCRNCEAGLAAYCLTVFPGDGGRCVRFRGDGPVSGRTGGISARPLRRLQLSAPSRRRQGLFLVQGAGNRHRPGKHQTLQSATARPHSCRQGKAVIDYLAPTAPQWGSRCIQAL